MRDLKSNHPLFNLLMRELRDHHTLTTEMNEGLSVDYRGRIVYHHRNCDGRCPNHICKSPYSSHICTIRHITDIFHDPYGCTGNPNCLYNHTSIYFTHKCGDEWLLGYSFTHACERMKRVQRDISKHWCSKYDFYNSYGICGHMTVWRGLSKKDLKIYY